MKTLKRAVKPLNRPLRRWLIRLIRDAMRERGLDAAGLRALTVGAPEHLSGVWVDPLLNGRAAGHYNELDDFDSLLAALGIELPEPPSLRGSAASSPPEGHEEAVI